MAPPPVITVIAVTHGSFPVAAELNHKIDPVHPILRATLDIAWEDPDPASAIVRIEQSLIGFSPSFERHECRGPRAYHVFLGDGAGPAPPVPDPAGGAFDGRLALAHVIEHVVIDFLFAINGKDRCSGVTGARRDAATRYDLLIECDDYPVGRLCLGLAVLVVTSAFLGRALGEAERDPIAVARLARTRPGRPLIPPEVGRILEWDESRTGRALAMMRQLGYLQEEAYAMNLSGVPEYRAARC
jgi:hypothetical protein